MTTIRPIVIDDTDTRVAYSGQWFQDNGSQDSYGNYGPTYMHTLHGTNANSSLSFSFNGTSVKILGTNNPTKVGDSLDPSWDCYVDKLKIESATPPTDRRNNFVLCESDSLSNGEHQITVNVTTHGQTFWFDSIQFVPRVGDSYDTAVTLVDNTDSTIEWSTGWALLGNTTANLTLVPGASVRLNFTGTSATWMSWISWGPPHPATTSSYSIDGGDEVSFNLPGLPDNATYDLFNQPSFTTPQLSPGPHSLLVTYHGDGGHTPLVLDYLLITNVTLSKNSTSTPTSGGFQPTSSPTSGKKSMVGPIVGGVVGGIALLGLIAALVFFFFRRRQRKPVQRMSIISDQINPTPGLAPFMTTAHANQPPKSHTYTAIPTSGSSHHLQSPIEDGQARLPSPYSEAGSAYGGIARTSQSSNPQGSSSGRMHTNNPSISEQSSASNWAGHGAGAMLVPMRKGQEARANQQSEPEIVHHQDSGIRMTQRPVVDIPPTYTEG